MKRTLIIFFLLISSFCSAGGPELVEALLPAFYHPFVSKGGQRVARAYFEHWTDDDITFFSLKIESLLKATFQMKVTGGAAELRRRFASNLVGIFGEVYGNTVMRNSIELAVMDTFFMTEVEYESLNPKGKKPDGILYRIVGDKLTLLKILESKSDQPYDLDQARGYFSVWETDGISVIYLGKVVQFAPETIRVEQDGAVIPIHEVTDFQRKKMTTLVGTSDRRVFAGHYIQLPVPSDRLWEIAEAFTSVLLNIRDLHARPVPTIPSVPTAPKSPVPDPAFLTENFLDVLNDFIVKYGDWPRKEVATLTAEQQIAKAEMRRWRGQAHVFIAGLSDAAKRALVRNRNLPALGPLERALMEQHSPTPEAVATLFSFVLTYKYVGLVNWLQQFQEWKDFFANRDLDVDAKKWLEAAECEKVFLDAATSGPIEE